MDTDRQAFIADIERHLTRLACDVILDPSASAVARLAGEFASELESRGAGTLAAQVQAAAGILTAETLGAECQRLWRLWIDEDEVRRDVEALAADAELTTMFVAEALDHLGTIEATLLKLEESPGDKTLMNDVFRPFHTIKGNAGALGVVTVQGLAHKVENLLDRCRSGQHVIGSTEIDIVLKSVDLITAMLHDLSARSAGQPGRQLRAERLALIQSVEQIIDSGGSAARPVPSADVPMPAADDHHDPLPRPKDEADRRPVTATEQSGSVKVDTRKLDGLVDTVGELVILQSLIYEDPAITGVQDERLKRNLAQLRRITTELQRGTMSMRMVPIRQTFQKMSRLVRDLGKRSGKPIELVLAGEDTELDRRVVEDINDPLMHMVRNSIDHGIESPEARLAAGKRETGRLSLRAFHQGGNIVIEIADDGAGLNTERILAKAEAQGLVPPGAGLSPAEIHHLIFAPGFSTAEVVTEISGRGVGMDVVRRNIEALRGRVEIQSEQGAGTIFVIKLPLTLAILDGLLVSVGNERFVVPTFAIRESLRPTPEQVHSIKGEPRLIQVRDELMPLVWLKELFDVPGPAVNPTEGTVVVIEEDQRRIGLVVDQLVAKQEVVVKNLGGAFASVRGVAGGAILGDGRIGLILDAHGIVSAVNQEART
jgi:two-component system chemotaxis sensor kinase CheA